MTICIAAICQQDKTNEEERIVLCYDWNAETAYGKSETSDKQRDLSKGWVALMADIIPRAEELIARYERFLSNQKEVEDDQDLFEKMKGPAHKQKESLADDYLKQAMGVSYADLVSPTKKFPDAVVEQRLNEVAEIQLRASIILAGFIKTRQADAEEKELNPYLFVVEDSKEHQDVVRIEENFAAVGSGAYVATPTMHQREHDNQKSLMETIYTVLEAKWLSEVVPGVGGSTTLHVMYPDGTLKRWSNALYDRLDYMFGKFGPKPILEEDEKYKEDFEFRDEYLLPIDAEEEEPRPRPGQS
jgi:hypothetical protein